MSIQSTCSTVLPSEGTSFSDFVDQDVCGGGDRSTRVLLDLDPQHFTVLSHYDEPLHDDTYGQHELNDIIYITHL